METFIKDLQYGVRSLRKRPAFVIVAIVTLALGIGANTAIFTLVNAVLLKTLPVMQPEELVLFSDVTGEGTSVEDTPRAGEWQRFSYSSYQYFRDHNQSFQDIAAVRSGENRLSIRRPGAGDTTQRGSSHLVSGNYFSLLGVGAVRGRVLTPEDDKPNAPPSAVISNRYWEQQLNSDPNVVGQNFILNGTSFTVVGITPPEFFGERVRRAPDFWLPLAFQPQIELRASFIDDNEAYWLMVIGRLKTGVSLAQAQATTNFALRQFLTEQAGSELTEDRQKGIQNTYVHLVSGAGGISGLRTIYSKPLHILMAIVGMVLLIACANVGSLLVARAASRKPEISLRMALGASRLRIVRQLLTESLLLAVVGGVCGALLSGWAVSLLLSLVTKDSPLDTRPDLLVLLFTSGVSLASGVLFGIAPALRATKLDLASAMKEKTQSKSGRLRFNLSSALVVAQVALSLVLLTGAGLFAQSLLKLQNHDVGFERSNVLVTTIEPRLAGYKPAELTNLYRQLLDRIGAISGVKTVSMATYAPMSGSARRSTISVPGYTPRPGEDNDVLDVLIGPDYAESLAVPMLQGREITIRDTPASQKVAVVNKTFADHYFPNQNPIGRSIGFSDPEASNERLEIVGVVGDVKWRNARTPVEAAVYRPILQVQDEFAYTVTLQMRTTGEPLEIGQTVRQAITQVDPRLPIYDVTSLSLLIQQTLNQDKLMAQLVSFFGLVALLLACIGLYGLMAHGVAQRTNEIGIRMALGARINTIIWMVLREVLILVAAGLVVGVPTALLATRFVSSQLFGLSATDPATLIGAGLTLILVALIAGFVPARRASRVNPLIALRYE